LQTDQTDVVEIQEVGSAAVRLNILLRQFKSNAGRIVIASLGVVDRQGDTGRAGIFSGDSLT
jgi:hypothetical protein